LIPKKIIALSLILIAPTALSSNIEDQESYSPLLTVENISESQKSDPKKVVEALGNTFIEAFQAKDYSQEKIVRSNQMLTSLICIQYNQMRQVEANKLETPKWEVKSDWVDPKGGSQASIMQLKASTRDLAAGYAMCQLWNTKHIPLDRFTGFNVDPIIDESKIKE
jgi:hypothetical protein